MKLQQVARTQLPLDVNAYSIDQCSWQIQLQCCFVILENEGVCVCVSVSFRHKEGEIS
jgi:hypothetical protein